MDMDEDKTKSNSDAFTRALNAIEQWNGQSVYHIERLVEAAYAAFIRAPREIQTSYCDRDSSDYQREINAIITEAVEAAGQSKFPEAWDNFDIPDHPTLAAVDAEGETLYFRDSEYDELVCVGYPLEPRKVENTR